MELFMHKSILATALILAFSGSVGASEYVWIDFNGDSSNSYQYDEPDQVGIHSPILTATTTNNEEWEYSGKAQLDTTGSKQNALLTSDSSRPVVVNKGELWIIGSGNGTAMDAGYNSGTEVVNLGTIYVNGKDPNQVKAMNANPNTKATNKGVIIVKGGAGMEDGSGGTNKSIINDGVISVVGNGVGINFRKEGGDSVSVVNNGQILVSGSGIGVHVGDTDGYKGGDDTNTANVGKIFTNNGKIISSQGGTAIKVIDGTHDAVIKFNETSEVEGLIDVNDSTILSFNSNTENLQLADEAGCIEAKEGSNVTVELGTESGLTIGNAVADDTSKISFNLSRMGTEQDKVLSVENAEGDLSVGYTGEVSDAIANGANTQDLFNGLDLGDYALDQVDVKEGTWGDAGTYVLNADGSVTANVQTNSLLTSATDLAITNALMWRSQLSNLSDRMGTLRTMPETAGAWARYNGGRLDGRGIEHDYNTIEVGFDKVISNNLMLGVSFDYTKGDTDLQVGTSDNNTYTFGLYGSYFNDSGCFLDAMLKVGRIDADYDLNNGISEKGDYMLTGTIIGIETGHRWDIQNYFIEPQVQLTYSYLRPESYTTNIRTVKFDDMKSLIARVGVMGGMKFAEDRGAAYVKASYNHDFLGDVEGTFTDGTFRRTMDDELDDNWGEVSLGASYQVTDSINTFVDVGTGFGGDIDQKWRVNLGARYVF